MKAVLDRNLHDTPPPGSPRRRLWCAPTVSSHSLIVMTATRLYLCPINTAPTPGVIEAIRQGGDPETLLGGTAVVVDTNDVRRVLAELLTDTLTLEIGTNRQTARRITVTFTSAESADELFTQLLKRIGDSCRLVTDQDDPIALARPTLGVMAGIALSTATLAMTINAIHDVAESAPGIDIHAPWFAAIAWMDWRIVCAFGGVLLAVIQVWLYRQFIKPPLRLELIRN